jgi:hypothetical protein
MILKNACINFGSRENIIMRYWLLLSAVVLARFSAHRVGARYLVGE